MMVLAPGQPPEGSFSLYIHILRQGVPMVSPPSSTQGFSENPQ